MNDSGPPHLPLPPPPPPRTLVLCFDGTGNTFRADGNHTNILKIFSMLDRNDDEFSELHVM